MLSEDVYEKVTERVVLRIEETNEKIIRQIAQTMKRLRNLSPTEIQQIAQMLKYGGDYNKIVKEISQMSKLSQKDIKEIFKEIAKKNQEFSKVFYQVQNVPFIPYEENKALQQQVESIAQITLNEFRNIARTKALGYLIRDENKKLVFRDLGYVYKDVIDKGVLSLTQGKETFDKVMYDMMKDIGSSGLRSIEFESGYTRRLDSQVRMNLMSGLRDMENKIQEEFGKEYGANGVEITTHEYPAPDHARAQGKQFSYEEFEKLQETGKATTYDNVKINMFLRRKDGSEYDTFRPISHLNCYHDVFYIVLGVQKPDRTNEELREIQERNIKGFELNGKHYTMYEGTQMQRQLETRIREQKDIQIMAEEKGDEKLAMDSQRKIRELTQRYKEFSSISGLPPKMERLKVSNYRRIALK